MGIRELKANGLIDLYNARPVAFAIKVKIVRNHLKGFFIYLKGFLLRRYLKVSKWMVLNPLKPLSKNGIVCILTFLLNFDVKRKEMAHVHYASAIATLICAMMFTCRTFILLLGKTFPK